MMCGQPRVEPRAKLDMLGVRLGRGDGLGGAPQLGRERGVEQRRALGRVEQLEQIRHTAVAKPRATPGIEAPRSNVSMWRCSTPASACEDAMLGAGPPRSHANKPGSVPDFHGPLICAHAP